MHPLSAKSFYKAWFKKMPKLMLFGVVFTFIVHYCLVPAAKFVASFIFGLLKVNHLSNDNFKQVLSQPSVLIVALIFMFMVGLLLLFELYVYIRLSWLEPNSPHQGGRLTMLERLRSDFKPLLRPAFIVYGPLALIILGLFGSGFSSTITSSFKVPEFILSTIYATPRYALIYFIVLLLGAAFLLRSCFWVHGLTIGHMGPYRAFKQSIRLTRFRWLYILWLFIKGALLILPLVAVIYFVFVGGALCLGFVLEKSLSLSGQVITAVIGSSRLAFFLSAIVYRAASALWLGRMYEFMGGYVDHVVADPIPLAQRSRSIRLQDKISRHPAFITAFSAFVIAIFVLQWLAIYANLRYDALPLNLQRPVLITAHRGSSTEAPENTLASLSKAMENKADMAEVDVQLTKDGRVVLFHDDDLRRICSQPGKIADYSYDELQSFDAGSHFDPSYSSERIPSLEQALDLCGSKLKLNIELKPHDGNEEALAQAVFEILKDKDLLYDVDITSLNKTILKKMDELDPYMDLGYILAVAVGKFDADPYIDFYSIEASFASSANIAKIHLQGKTIAVWTVNNEREIKEMRDKQVDNIITDDPLLARRVLSENPFEQTLLQLLLSSR